MRKTRTAAAFALLLFLVSATPSFAANDRERIRERNRDLSPIERVIQAIRHIVKPLEEILIPRP